MTRTALCAALIALGALHAVAQDEKEDAPRKSSWNQKKPGQAYKPWAGYNKPGTVQWTEDIEEAFAKAAKEKKLVLIVNFVGEMKFEGC